MFKKEVPKLLSFKESLSNYSLVTKAGPLIFFAGQLAYDLERKIVIQAYKDLPDEEGRRLATGRTTVDEKEGPIIAQTWFIYNNLKRMLEELGSSLDLILHTHIYMLNLERDFPGFERVRSMFFKKGPPASTAVEVTRLAVKDCLIEIEPIALVSQ